MWCCVLPVRGLVWAGAPLGVPASQPDSRVERPRVARPVGRGGGASVAHESHARVHEPRVPSAVRGGVQLRPQRRARDDSRQRACHLRLAMGTRRAAQIRACCRGCPEGRRDWFGACRFGRRLGPRAPRCPCHGGGAPRPCGRPSHVRHPEHEAREVGGHAPYRAHGRAWHRVSPEHRRGRFRGGCGACRGIRRGRRGGGRVCGTRCSRRRLRGRPRLG